MRLMRSEQRQSGFTLLEITIILAVIAILGLILAPSVISFINSSRLARAQSDVEALANAAADFYRDNGFFPQYADTQRSVPIRLLVTPGAIPESGNPPATDFWVTSAPGDLDFVVNQLINNRPSFGTTGYPLKTTISSAGWNGPYLAGEVQADPWGNRYSINVEFLSVNLGATEADGVQEKRAVWALSAGPDGRVETTYPTDVDQLIGNAVLDPGDLGVRIQ